MKKILSNKRISAVADLFLAARRNGVKMSSVPEHLWPIGNDEAHAIQDLVTSRLGEAVGGWKPNPLPSGGVIRASISKSRVFSSPARIRSDLMPLRGIEAKIAFRFLKPLPVCSAPYTRAQVIDAVEPLAAIEILDSRFKNSDLASAENRLADFMSHGGIVTGEPHTGWTIINLAALDVTFTVDEYVLKRCTATHPVGDPLEPALALVDELRLTTGVAAGQIMTKGSWTGADYVRPGSEVIVSFANFTPVRLAFC